MKKTILIMIIILIMLSVLSLHAEENILIQYQKAGIWKIDRTNHRCLIDSDIWVRIPFNKKEQILQVIYVEEKTWWEIYDMYSGKLLGKVNSWGWKIYP